MKNLEVLVLPSESIPSKLDEKVSKPVLTNSKPMLTNSDVNLTTQSDPCPFCHENQCVYYYSHKVYFTVKAACDETLETLWKRKPPDDPSG